MRNLAPKIIGLTLALSADLASATPVYRYEALRYGDTAGVSDINDLGQILWTGFCDSTCRALVDDEWLTPLPGAFGAGASKINNAGDVLGFSYLWEQQQVDTLWLDGVPHDLSDPVNAGLVFVADPGPTVVDFDLLALQVLNLPSKFLPVDCIDCPTPEVFPAEWRANQVAQTNARGDLVFSYARFSNHFDFYAILRPVAEPASVALVLTALLAAALASTARPRRVEPGT